MTCVPFSTSRTSNLALTSIALSLCPLAGLSLMECSKMFLAILLSMETGAVVCGFHAMCTVDWKHRTGRALAILAIGIGLLMGSCFVTMMTEAFALPPRLNARVDATVSCTKTIRARIQLYYLQHDRRYPTFNGMSDWSALLQRTNRFGEITPDGECGPYLESVWFNPLTNSSVIVRPHAANVATAGWVYDDSTGQFQAICVHSHWSQITPSPELVIVP